MKKTILSIFILLLVFIVIFFNQDIKRKVYQFAPDKIKLFM